MPDSSTATSSDGGIRRASALLASGTFVSRILGFVSAIVLAQTLGTVGAGADTFALANQLPNNIYAIVAGGILSAVLVPQIVKAGLHDDGGQRFINRLITLGAVIFIAAAVLATVGAPLLVALYAQQGSGGGEGFSDAELRLATAFAYWCLPQVLFYALYSLLGEVLNARKIFGPFTWAPILNNVVAIAGLAAFAAMFGTAPAHANAGTWTPGMIALIGGSATVGVVAQALILSVFWKRAGLSYRPDFRWRGVGLSATGKAAAWTFGMILVTQLAGIVQTNVASLAATGDNPSLAILRYSWLIFMLPHSIVTVSIATAYFTKMAGHARDGERAAVRADVSASLRSIGMVMVLATVVLMVVSYPFARLFGGDFDDVSGMGNVLIAFLPGLIPFSVLFVLQRTFYALEDTRTPFFIQLFQSALFVGGALTVANLDRAWIAFGIAAVTTLAGTAQTILAAVILRRRLGGIDAPHIVRDHSLYLLAALPAAAVGFLLLAITGGTEPEGFALSSEAAAIVSMLIVGAGITAVYVGGLAALRVEEFRTLVRLVARRIHGRRR